MLVVGLSRGDPGNLDPTTGGNVPFQEIEAAMCQRLYGYDAEQHLVPLLAAAAPAISKDKLGYTIQLRRGIDFNDGTPLNAQAVVTSVLRHMTYPGSQRASDFESVESVSASGPYTVVYRLKQRDSSFIGGNPYVMSPTQLTKLGDNFGADPICVGPFMFDHRVVGDNVTLIKSPYYYDQKDVFLDKIVYKPMSDAAAAAAALQSGDLQALDQVSTTELQAVQQTSSLRIIKDYQLGWKGLIINMGNKNGCCVPGHSPYTNVGTPLASSPKLRQAFEEAIDRNAFNRVVYGGLYQPSCTPIPPSNTAWYDATKAPCTAYDPKDARRLVAASGYPNPTVTLLAGPLTDFLREAQFIQAQEAAVGINVVIDSSADPTRPISGGFDVRLGGAVPGMPDPTSNIDAFLATWGSRNFGGYSNPRLDLILSNGRKATSIQARSTLYRVAQQIIGADRPIIVLYNPITLAAFNTSLTGLELNAAGTLTVVHARYR